MTDRIEIRRPETFRPALRILIALLALTLLPAGCKASDTVEIGPDDNGRQVELKTGQELVITLEANPTTGYSWDADPQPETILQAAGEPEFESQSEMVGAGGTQIMRFEAVEAGEGTLTLIYHRPWEKDVDPIETFSIDVVVR